MRKLSLTLFLFLLPAAAAQNATTATPTTGSDVTQTQTGEAGEDYVIGLQDVLLINVWREPELSVQVVVRPDGKITMPLIDELDASGLTTQKLKDVITEKLKKYITAPTVTVVVSEINSQTVSVMGHVFRPGSYPLGSPITLVELLARAGGFREFANQKKVRVVRKGSTQTQQFRFNYKRFVDGKDLHHNITLENGDVVIVP